MLIEDNRRMSQQPIKPIELTAALTLAGLVLDFEIENSDAPEWQHELKRARLTISQAINRTPAGDYFISPDQRRRGREAKY